MVMFKACPRCSGDMHVNRDFYGNYRECLMCGYMQDVEDKKRESLGFVMPTAEIGKKAKSGRKGRVATKVA